jgi:hypothetical protein
VSEYQPSEIRISDSEREDALGKLGEHMSAGRLDIDEYGERSARVATAKTRGELLGLFGDLPEPKPTFGQPRPAGLPVPRERTFAEKYLTVAAPVAMLVLVAGVLFAFHIPFFLPFLFFIFIANHRRGTGRRWDGRGPGGPRGMGHERG